MQQLKTLIKKELISYFRSNLIYFIAFIYIFSSIVISIYWGAFFAMHDSALYSLFHQQPIILIFIIPALTMKTWSEEYKSGTIEFLLTQPIPTKYIVLSKFLSSSIVCIGISLLFIPFILYSSLYLNLDWQNILVSFIGLWLIMITFCALGCLISSLNKSIILSYIISAFTLAIITSFPYSNLYKTYNNYMFAEIGLPDITYFVVITIASLLLNNIVPEYKKSTKHNNVFKFIFLSLAALIISILINIIFINLFSSKIDLTYHKIYTPKQKTKEIISQTDSPIYRDVYASKDYISSNTDYYRYHQQVIRFLKKYETLSKGMIRIDVKYVEPFSELEEAILKDGLYFEENNKGSRNYFGAIVHNKESKTAIIKQFLHERHSFLEKDIDIALLKTLENNRLKKVAVYLDPTQNLDVFQGSLLSLENDYNVGNINSSVYFLSPKLDLIILLNPKNLPNHLMYAIDQYILTGGKVIVLFDFFTQSQTQTVNLENISISKFFDHWGIQIKNKFSDKVTFSDLYPLENKDIKISKASVFDIKQGIFNSQILLSENEDIIATILTGKTTSIFNKNPYITSDLSIKDNIFLPESINDTQIALIADVDILDDDNWISSKSPDKNPFSTISSSGNGEFFKSLIDYMTGNKDYLMLPINNQSFNKQSIGEKQHDAIWKQYEEPYQKLKEEITQQKIFLYEQSNENLDKMNTLLQITSIGKKIGKQEKSLQNMEYKLKSEYSKSIKKTVIFQAFIIPLLEIFLLLAVLRIKHKAQQKKIKDKYND